MISAVLDRYLELQHHHQTLCDIPSEGVSKPLTRDFSRTCSLTALDKKDLISFRIWLRTSEEGRKEGSMERRGCDIPHKVGRLHG